jgi:hypothetical protein
MKPIYIILYAIIVTTVLTSLFSQSQASSPGQERLLLILVAVGLTILGNIILFISLSI